MHLDDYEPSIPRWLLVCLALDGAGAQGLSKWGVHVEVMRLSDGRVARWASILSTLRRMRADGMVVERSGIRGRRRSKVLTLSDDGRELYREACAHVARTFALSSLFETKAGKNGNAKEKRARARR
jgi:DNA-binding PadR family transcriptional regulator